MSIRAPGLEVQVIRSVPAFAALRSEWDQLLARGGYGVCNSWAWQYSWLTRLEPTRSLNVFTVRDGAGALLGVLPLAGTSHGGGSLRAVRWAPLAETSVASDFLDLVAAPDAPPEARLALWQAVADHATEWDLLELTDVDPASPMASDVAAVFGRAADVRTWDGFPCPFGTLDPEVGWADFLAGKPRAANYLRRARWFSQHGGRIEVVSGPDGLDRALAAFFRLHDLRWASEGGSAGIVGPRLRGFHRAATRYLAESGFLRMFTLYVGEESVASVYGMTHGSCFTYYQSGYDPAWARRSPGLVLLGETFRRALEERCRRYEFLRGEEEYKREWVGQVRTTQSVLVVRSTVGRMLAAAERTAARARTGARHVAGPRLRASVRSARRAVGGST